jgi:alginate O-acetyltransferase complex protein AlgI
LTRYIYNPLALSIARWRARRGLPALRPGRVTIGAFCATVAFPMITTMFISGIWHGAGMTFLMFGLIHGLGLVANHAWNLLKRRPAFPDRTALPSLPATAMARLLTMSVVTVAFVFFGAPTMAAARKILAALIGLHGINIPTVLVSRFPGLATFAKDWGCGVAAYPSSVSQSLVTILLLIAVIEWLPNVQTWLGSLGQSGADSTPAAASQRLWLWRPTVPQALFCGALFAWAVISLIATTAESTFIYFQF